MMPGWGLSRYSTAVFAVILFTCAFMGASIGASADSLENATLNETRIIQNVTENWNNSSAAVTDNPGVPNQLEDPVEDTTQSLGVETPAGPYIKQWTRWMMLSMLEIALGVANTVAVWAYHNRGWISPIWLQAVGQGTMFSFAIGYAYVTIRRVRRVAL